MAAPAPPSAEQRRAARDLVSRAQEAAIVSDDATARDLYQRASRLDPTDPAIAYALARSYEAAHDARAITEYCRFLALQPAAPEAPDVRRRIASLAFELAPRGATAAAARLPAPSPPAPGTALAYGILFPGGGQYYTHRPLPGFLVTAATAGLLYYGLQQQRVTETETLTGLDPNGHTYTYAQQVTRMARPNIAAGIGAAAAISLIAAVEASSHARAARRIASGTRALIVAPTAQGFVLGARLAISP